MRHELAALFVSAIVLGSAVNALGEDFTFTIPINVTAIAAEFAEAGALCKVQDASDSIGEGHTTVPIPTGGTSQNVVVKLNVAPSKNPASARTYFCLLVLKRANGYMRPALQSDLKPGTTSTLQRRGDLPQ